jgi:hypothetical protein
MFSMKPFKGKEIYFNGFLWLNVLVFFANCDFKKKESQFVYKQPGYYYKLLSFDENHMDSIVRDYAWISATFSSLSDSVFWDSYNNFNDNFYIAIDTNSTKDYLTQCISRASVSDSVCLLIHTLDFFKFYYKSSKIPYFCKNDSVVKVNLKVKSILSVFIYNEIREELMRKESDQISAFFANKEAFEKSRDPSGFYWIEKPYDNGFEFIEKGEQLKLSYEGYYLNGRFLESSAAGFEFVYGTPDQLLPGLNYVIKRLKKGQNAKIILPSWLAFGERGSSNGTVPPFTPLVYKIKVNQ